MRNNRVINSFGEYLRRIRKDRGLTLVQLQNESGVSNSYLSQIENNQFKPSNDVLEKISKPLNISVLDLMVAAGDIPESAYKEYWDAELKKFEYEMNLKQTLQKSFKSMTDMAYFNSGYYVENNNDSNDKIETELKKIDSQLNLVIGIVKKQIVIENLEDNNFKSILLFIDSYLDIENINDKRQTVYYFLKERDNIVKSFDKFLDYLTPFNFMNNDEFEEYAYEQVRALTIQDHKHLEYPDIGESLKSDPVYFKGKLLDKKIRSLSIKILDILTEDLEVNYPSDEEIQEEVDKVLQDEKIMLNKKTNNNL